MSTTIKREKRGNMFFMVARRNGKIVALRRWSPKTFNKQQAFKIFKTNQSFNPDIVRTNLVNVDQVLDRTKRKPQQREFQYFIVLEINRERIEGRSMKTTGSVKAAREEALENALMRFAGQTGVSYDADTGQELFIAAKQKRIVDEGIVYYARR